MEQLVSLCKRRGFIFQNAEIYGGLQGSYDYGPLGAELKNNLKAAWWRAMIYERDDIEGLDSNILTHAKVLEYSGHVATFHDMMVDCRKCKARMRADHIKDGKCDTCGSTDLTDPRPFNMMFKTNIGPVDDGKNTGYLRPETAQGIFTQFRNVVDSTARKCPFGIAQIGKAFRNEITPRNFLFRVREFEQMELEFFVKPGTDLEWHEYWKNERIKWWVAQGLAPENIRPIKIEAADLAHYSKATYDIHYKFPHGFDELEGIADRTDYDLGNHTKNQSELNISAHVHENKDSTEKMALYDDEAKKWYVPFVIEPSAGVDRGVVAVLTEAYAEEALANGETRTVLKLRPHLAPVKVAVIPLKRNEPKIVALAKDIKNRLLKTGVGRVMYEDTGNIGKGYRRHDEIGTPYCLTVDFESLENGTITVRDRDSMEQKRISLDTLEETIKGMFL